jgi:hypothetical protein
MLVALTSCSSVAQSTTPSPIGDRARALREIETSQTSNLDAVPALVDRSLDRRVEADVQEISRDPSLLGLGADEPDARVTSLSTSSDDAQIRSHTTLPAATSWSHVPAAELTTQAEPARSDVTGDLAAQPTLLPAPAIAAEAADRSFPGGSASDSETNSSRQSWLSRKRVEQRERAKRQARELAKKLDQQCSQLRTGEAECRLKLKEAHADVSPDGLQTWR